MKRAYLLSLHHPRFHRDLLLPHNSWIPYSIINFRLLERQPDVLRIDLLPIKH